MVIICDSVILSRPPLILISHGGLTDSNEEQKEYPSLTVLLTLLLESTNSDGGRNRRYVAQIKPCSNLSGVFFFPAKSFGSPANLHLQAQTHTHAHTHHVKRGEMAQIGRRGDKQGVSGSRNEQGSEARFISTSSGGRPPT